MSLLQVTTLLLTLTPSSILVQKGNYIQTPLLLQPVSGNRS